MAANTNVGGGGGGNVPIFIPDILKNVTMTASTVQPFIYSAQTPLQIELGANFNANSQAIYEFEIAKNGYDTIKFTSSTLNASTTPPTYYLASGYHDILRNWNNTTASPVYIHSGVTVENLVNLVWPQQKYGFYNYGDVYINGIVLLANVYLDNTNNTTQYITGNSLKVSYFTNASGTYRADFKPAPITVIAETNELLSPQTKGQIGYLAIATGYGSALPTGAIPDRSFDLRTGTTSPYNTYYTNDYYAQYASWYWNFYYNFYSSGGTAGTNSSNPRSIREFLQDGYTPYGITSKGLIGTSPIVDSMEGPLYNVISSSVDPSIYVPFYNAAHFIKLESQPGIPFDVKNIKQLRYTSGPNAGQDLSFSLAYVETHPAEIVNVTINKANNHMGGFSLVQP